MSIFKHLDDVAPIERQIGFNEAPVVLSNLFTMDAVDEQEFLDAWRQDTALIKLQPGFRPAQLHRSVSDHPSYLVYAIWESVALFRVAISHPDYIEIISHFPSLVVSRPHLFRKIAVPGVCGC